MRIQYTAATAMLAGVAIGAAAVQSLHAQTKPPAYVVIAIRSITDPDAMKTVAQRASPEALAAAGGHYVVRTNEITALEGAAPKRFVMIAFDNLEKAQAWRNSPTTKETTAIRSKATDSESFMVEGVAN